MIRALVRVGVPALAFALAAMPSLAAPGPIVEPGVTAGGFVGSVDLAPTHGASGTTVALAVRGLPPRQSFDVVWSTVTGRWNAGNGEYKGRTYTPVAYRLATLQSDVGGSGRVQFSVPDDYGFVHDVALQQGARLFTKAAFRVDMSVDVAPKDGPPGTPITIDVKGIGWRHMENSWLLLYDNAFTGWMSSVTTNGHAKFTIPAAGPAGVHVIEVLHGDFTFPYRNMQQSPAPDRPRFVRMFTVTDGMPILPPAPATQRLTEPRDAMLDDARELVSTPPASIVGEPIVLRGRGFPPDGHYELTWKTVSGNRVGGSGWEERSRTIAGAQAARDGTLEFRFATPDDLGGVHEMVVTGNGANRKGMHVITPSAAPLEVARGPAGTPFTIHLKGVGWTETANIYTIVYDNRYIGYGCGFNSQGDAQFTLHASGEPGWHFIDLYPAIYKGKETRPDNFRLPQLTYERDHPGEDLPRFRFAFEVTAK
jgi:hypothetical protein